jgi:DNA polymerase bacteriophage-type
MPVEELQRVQHRQSARDGYAGMTRLFLDFESRSLLDITVVGLYNYVTHPSTEPILLSYAFDDGQVGLWQEHIHGNLPESVLVGIADPTVELVAWNSAFERHMLKHKFGVDTPFARWIDPMINSRFMSAPGKLEDACPVFNIPLDQAKLKEGEQLIQMFCSPCYRGGEETLFGISEPEFRNWDSNPREWEQFCRYCINDTESERAILNKMRAFPLPERERHAWYIDQEINERGVFCDLPLARGSAAIAEQVKSDLHREIKSITSIDNPNSNPQILAWLKTQGYSFSGIGKGFVARALDGECPLTDGARRVLELRKQSAKTSDAKLETILESVCDDGRLRHQYAFMGASRTGRWSGKGDYGGAQLQNLPRPNKAVAKRLDTAIELLRASDYLGLSLEFASPMEAVTTAIRSVLRAAPGKKLLICDLNAVENRVLGWLTNCPAISEVFKQGRCPYLSFAARMYQLDYDELVRKYEAGDEEVIEMRQNSKAPVLGGGYQLSGGEEKLNEDGDKIYTGLMGYARNLGIEMDRDFAHESVDVFRSVNGEVVDFWRDSEEAAKKAVRTGKITTIGPLTFRPCGKTLLQMILPSGRPLNYIRPKIEPDENYGKDGVTYEGKIQGTNQWGRIKGYGGKWTEQSDQGIARDLLVDGMFEADKIHLPIVSHTHDELVAEVDEDSEFALDDLRACMIKTPEWANGLILDAEGFVTEYYKK